MVYRRTRIYFVFVSDANIQQGMPQMLSNFEIYLLCIVITSQLVNVIHLIHITIIYIFINLETESSFRAWSPNITREVRAFITVLGRRGRGRFIVFRLFETVVINNATYIFNFSVKFPKLFHPLRDSYTTFPTPIPNST